MSERHTRGGLNAHSGDDASWQARQARTAWRGGSMHIGPNEVIAGDYPPFPEEVACYCSGLRHEWDRWGCPEEAVKVTEE